MNVVTPPPPHAPRESARAGFSIIEGLVALALTGVIMTTIATLIGQWFPVWNRGFHNVQLSDLYAVALDRVAADLAEAQYVTPERTQKAYFFDGAPNSVTFVRPTLDPGERRGLEIVRLSTFADKSGAGLVRRRARFTPMPRGTTAAQDFRFSSSVVVLRTNAQISFSYGGADGAWRAQWDDPGALPARVRIDVRDPSGDKLLALSTTAAIRANAPASCAGAASMRGCGGNAQQQAQTDQNAPPSPDQNAPPNPGQSQ